jgi:hypothetical protein
MTPKNQGLKLRARIPPCVTIYKNNSSLCFIKKNDTPSIVNESSFQKMYRVELFMCLTEQMHFFFHQYSSTSQQILWYKHQNILSLLNTYTWKWQSVKINHLFHSMYEVNKKYWFRDFRKIKLFVRNVWIWEVC